MSVSIVIPTYNRPDYLDRLLQSIGDQTYKNFEVIVVDDFSPNYSEYLNIIKKYESIFTITFIRNPKNLGAPYSRNQGILKAQFQYIALVDDDDVWLPCKLEAQINVFKNASESLGLIYTWTDVVDSQKNERIPFYRATICGMSKKAILRECFIPSPSVMVRKKAILNAGLFDEAFPSCQDWDMWTRIIFAGYQVQVIPQVLTLYYKHGNATIGTSPKAKLGYFKYYKKHFFKLVIYFEWRHILRMLRLVLKI